VLLEALRVGGVYPVTDTARVCLTRRRDFNGSGKARSASSKKNTFKAHTTRRPEHKKCSDLSLKDLWPWRPSGLPGGRRTLAYFNTGIAVETKADNTPVTRADRESEEVFRERITRMLSESSIIGERRRRDRRQQGLPLDHRPDRSALKLSSTACRFSAC
jgi:hypothetical protein